MKPLFAILALILAIMCSDPADSGKAFADETEATVPPICGCVNEPIRTDAQAIACGALFDSMTPEQIVEEKIACQNMAGVPDGGPDICYCLQVIAPEPTVAAACMEILPENMSPAELSARIVACSR